MFVMMRNYRLLKDKYQQEIYTLVLDPTLRSIFAKFRLRAHTLNIESRRFDNNIWVPPYERQCTLCNSGEPQDEFHILINCSKLNSSRHTLYTKICQICPSFIFLDNWEKYLFMGKYGNGDSEICKIVACFLYDALKTCKDNK